MKLQEPFQIKDVKFQSRITMAPMVPFGFPEGEQNSISDEVLEYYKKRIHGDLGLLITMSFSVDARKSVLKGYGLYNEKQKEALGKLIQICHENHTRILVQLSFPSNGHHRHDTIDHWSKEELKKLKMNL